MSAHQEDQDSGEFTAMVDRVNAESRAFFDRQHPNGVERPDPMPELADKVEKAIDEWANGHEDDAAQLFPAVRLDRTDPHHAGLIDRLQRGEGKPFEIKLEVDKDGSHWAARDVDAAVERMDAEERDAGGAS